MKNLILAAFFLVTWNQYELKQQWATPGSYTHQQPDYYTVETTTHTITLATQKDVDLFYGEKGHAVKVPVGIDPDTQKTVYAYDWVYWEPGLIGDKAFNIQVKEVKP